MFKSTWRFQQLLLFGIHLHVQTFLMQLSFSLFIGTTPPPLHTAGENDIRRWGVRRSEANSEPESFLSQQSLDIDRVQLQQLPPRDGTDEVREATQGHPNFPIRHPEWSLPPTIQTPEEQQ